VLVRPAADMPAEKVCSWLQVNAWLLMSFSQANHPQLLPQIWLRYWAATLSPGASPSSWRVVGGTVRRARPVALVAQCNRVALEGLATGMEVSF
jgi:hypothetical protein